MDIKKSHKHNIMSTTNHILDTNTLALLEIGKQDNGKISDSENPLFTFSLTDTSILISIANGSLDARTMAKYELANRGLASRDLNSPVTWVGFKEARKIYGLELVV